MPTKAAGQQRRIALAHGGPDAPRGACPLAWLEGVRPRDHCLGLGISHLERVQGPEKGKAAKA